MSLTAREHIPDNTPALAPEQVCIIRNTGWQPPEVESAILFRNAHSTEAAVGKAYFNTHFGPPAERDIQTPRAYMREYQTHNDKEVVLSRLVSAAAIHLSEHGSAPKDLYLASGDGTAGLFAGALCDITEQVETDPELVIPPRPEPIFSGDFSFMTDTERGLAQEAYLEKHKDDLRSTVDQLHESVVNESLLALAGIRLVMIPSGNGCDAASEYQQLGGSIPAPKDWTDTRHAYPVRATVKPPNGRPEYDIDVLNYLDIGTGGKASEYLMQNRERWRKMRVFRKSRRFAHEALKSLSLLESTRVTIDGEELASYAVIVGSRFAKIIRTGQSHSDPSFDIVKESAKNGWLSAIWSGLRLIFRGAHGERQSKAKITLGSGGSLEHDGEYGGELEAGTKMAFASRRYPVKVAAASHR